MDFKLHTGALVVLSFGDNTAAAYTVTGHTPDGTPILANADAGTADRVEAALHGTGDAAVFLRAFLGHLPGQQQ